MSPRTEGTPQGGPLSPLLSNILLDEWDRELERRGHRFVRYADDCNVYVRSQAAGERVMASLERWLTPASPAAGESGQERRRTAVDAQIPWLQCDVGPGRAPPRSAGSRQTAEDETAGHAAPRARPSPRRHREGPQPRHARLGRVLSAGGSRRRASRIWISGFAGSCAASCGGSGNDHEPGSANFAGTVSTRLAPAHPPITATGRGGMRVRVICTRPCPPPCFGSLGS